MRRHRLSALLRAAVPVLGLSLGACDPASQAMLAGASLVTFVHTDKTLGDHMATWAFDQDCSVLYAADGEPYCQRFVSEEERRAAEAAAAAQQANTYCYRTLGAINCFREADSLASTQARVR